MLNILNVVAYLHGSKEYKEKFEESKGVIRNCKLNNDVFSVLSGDHDKIAK
jgi:hypothetical protein